MKTGRSLTELAAELERQSAAKKDYLAGTRRLHAAADADGKLVLQGVNGGMMLRPTAHGQLAATLQIPKTYYDRMLEQAPDLLATNVNLWLERQPAKKLIRTLDGQVRAILSDNYRPLDNFELAEAVIPKLIDLTASVVSGEVTESRFYLKAVTERITGEVTVGDRINAGIVVSNSEVGQGSLKVQALDFRLVCTNGMIREEAIRKAHLGRGSRGQDAIEDAREYFRSETRAADDRAFFMKVQDATAAMFDQLKFDRRILEYRNASEKPIQGDPEKVVEVTAKHFGLNEKERSSVLRHLLRGNDMSQWGLANAITRTAEDAEQYDRATELEALGGTVIELAPKEWRTLAGERQTAMSV